MKILLELSGIELVQLAIEGGANQISREMWDVLTPAHKTAPCSMNCHALVAPDVEVDPSQIRASIINRAQKRESSSLTSFPLIC